MMGRWGLQGMRSFEQVDVARKEGAKFAAGSDCTATPRPQIEKQAERTQTQDLPGSLCKNG